MDRFRIHRSIPRETATGRLGGCLLAVALAFSAARDLPAQNPGEDLKFANGLFQQRRYDLAAEEYRKFLDANAKSTAPEVASATYALATCKLFLGQYAEARKAFEDFLLLDPDNPNVASARFRVGETSYLLGDVEKGAKALKQYLDDAPADHPQRDSALVYAGDLSLRQEKPRDAEASYAKALAEFPKGRLVTRAIGAFPFVLRPVGKGSVDRYRQQGILFFSFHVELSSVIETNLSPLRTADFALRAIRRSRVRPVRSAARSMAT